MGPRQRGTAVYASGIETNWLELMEVIAAGSRVTSMCPLNTLSYYKIMYTLFYISSESKFLCYFKPHYWHIYSEGFSGIKKYNSKFSISRRKGRTFI